MTFRLIKQTDAKTAVKTAILILTAIAASFITAMPVLAGTYDADNTPSNIIVYDNRERTLKITEISFTYDFMSMSVLVENIQTMAQFRVDHELNTGDTFNEYIEITATDGLGNVSETVHIKNPFYLPEITESVEEPEPIIGSLSVTGGSGGNGNNNGSSESTFINGVPVGNVVNGNGNDITDSDNDKNSGGFNTNGWATVVDNAVSGSKEFFIVRSDRGNEFYIIIDRENGRDNVYFLNAVTEWDCSA